MFTPQTYLERRKALKALIKEGLVLFLGNELSSMNYKDNTYPFRQDSSFLYYFAINQPNFMGIIDVDENKDILLGHELSMEDIVWEGNQPTMVEKAASAGLKNYASLNDLAGLIQKAQVQGRKIHYLPPYRPEHRVLLHQLLNIPLSEIDNHASTELIKAIVAQRSIKSPEEIDELHHAANITRNMHLAAMKLAKAGMKESEVMAAVYHEALAAGGDISYPIILTINGQTLHNHYHGNTLQSGQMILIDAGAQTANHYAGDMTRTFPVDPTFTTRQKEIYEIVLAAEEAAAAASNPGVYYMDVHLMVAKRKVNGLKDLGLMKGDVDEAVAQGAHALFFPHGLGHMLGMDVHDMEGLGEDFVGYDETIQRNPQFGLKSLRLGRKLEPGFAITIEPGIYFIPELIDQWRAAGKFNDFINYEALESYKDFSGIRIEEDFIITETGAQLLGDPLAKSIEDVEEIRRKA